MLLVYDDRVLLVNFRGVLRQGLHILDKLPLV